MLNKIINDIFKESAQKISITFPTQESYDKYMKDHPGADPSYHKVQQLPEHTKKNLMKKLLVRKLKRTLDKAESGGYRGIVNYEVADYYDKKEFLMKRDEALSERQEMIEQGVWDNKDEEDWKNIWGTGEKKIDDWGKVNMENVDDYLGYMSTFYK